MILDIQILLIVVFWPESLKSELFSYLEKKANLERWLDLESELARYIQTVRKESSAYVTQDLEELNKTELILRKLLRH